MAKKNNRPSWFKMFDSQRAIIEAVPDEIAGKALKTAFVYFGDRNIALPDMDTATFAVFSAIKQYIDESYADY